MHQQTRQNKTKTKQKNVRQRNNTRSKIPSSSHQPQQDSSKKKLDNLTLNSSLASRCSICRSHSAALRWTSVVASWWNAWVKRFGVWDQSFLLGVGIVGIFLVASQKLAAKKKKSWVNLYTWQTVYPALIKTLCTKTGGGKGRTEKHIMTAKIREMNLPIPVFWLRFLADFLWSLLTSKGWPAFQVKVKEKNPTSFHSKDVDQQ